MTIVCTVLMGFWRNTVRFIFEMTGPAVIIFENAQIRLLQGSARAGSAPLAWPRGNEADRKTYDVTVCFSAMLAYKWVPLPRAKESLLTGNWNVYKEYNQCRWTVLKIHERDRRWWNNKADVGRTAAPKLRRGRLLSCPPSSPSTRNWAKYIHSKSLRCKTS